MTPLDYLKLISIFGFVSRLLSVKNQIQTIHMKTKTLFLGVATLLLLIGSSVSAQQIRDPYIEAQLQENRGRASVNTHSLSLIHI